MMTMKSCFNKKWVENEPRELCKRICFNSELNLKLFQIPLHTWILIRWIPKWF